MTTMDCTTAREEILVADLAELREEADSELAAHLRSCAECRARADAILRQHNAMASGLAAMRPAAQVVPMRKRPALRWLPVPLAAAAALALLLVRQQSPEPLPNIDALARRMFREAPVIAPSAGQQAMVIEKNNMTIVWLYKEETL